MPGVCQLDSLDILMAGADRPFSLTEKLALALGSRNVGRFWYALYHGQRCPGPVQAVFRPPPHRGCDVRAGHRETQNTPQPRLWGIL